MKVFQVLDKDFNGVALFNEISEAIGFMTDNGFVVTGRHNLIEGISSIWNAGTDNAYIVRYLLDDAIAS